MSIPAAVVLGSTIILGLMLIAGFYLQVYMRMLAPASGLLISQTTRTRPHPRVRVPGLGLFPESRSSHRRGSSGRATRRRRRTRTSC